MSVLRCQQWACHPWLLYCFIILSQLNEKSWVLEFEIRTFFNIILVTGHPWNDLGLYEGTRVVGLPKGLNYVWHVWMCGVVNVEPVVLGRSIVSSMFSVSLRCCLPAYKFGEKVQETTSKCLLEHPFESLRDQNVVSEQPFQSQGGQGGGELETNDGGPSFVYPIGIASGDSFSSKIYQKCHR